MDATAQAISDLGYVQIDTISVVARAHHHTLWNRNPRYQPADLDKLLESRRVFEYWSHAAAYLPIGDYRFSLPKKHAEAEGSGHWHARDIKLEKQVLKRICDEGPLMARDFSNPNPGKTEMWHWKPAKIALEQLFMEGKLMTTRRQGFNKVYDLTERVLPDGIDTKMPSEWEYAEHLICAYLFAQGIGQAAEMAYLRKGWKPTVEKTLKDLMEEGKVEMIQVGKEVWYTLPESLQLISKPLNRSRAIILSPFDNFIIQRKRIQQLFDFAYQIECYVPEPKRQFGYFVLPVIWQGKLVARMDCKAHRQQRHFQVKNLYLESKIKVSDQLAKAVAKAIIDFAEFNACFSVLVDHTVPKTLKPLLLKELPG